MGSIATMFSLVLRQLLIISFLSGSSFAQSCEKNYLTPLTAFHDGVFSRTGSSNASGVYSSQYESYHAFSSDGIFWVSEPYQDPAWISYNFEDATDPTVRIVNAYRFYFCNGPSLTTRAPKRFELQVFVKNEGLDSSTISTSITRHINQEEDGEWVTVDYRCCETNWHGCEERTYHLGNPVTGKRFRFLFHEDNDNRAPIVVISLRNIQLL